jgi:hypothetical protein
VSLVDEQGPVEDPMTDGPDRLGRQRVWLSDTAAAGIGAVAAALLFLLVHRALSDDTYITLSCARNLAFHGHWGLTAFRTSNVATSPLNVWLLAAFMLPIRAPVAALGLFLMATCAAQTVWMNRISRVIGASWLTPVATLTLLLVNPLLITSIGLEFYLAAALLTGMVYYAITGRVVLTGVLAGLLVLTRPDLVVVPAAVAVVLFGVRRATWFTAAIGLAVVLPWHIFTWFALGTAVPDTFAFKTITGHFDNDATLIDAPFTWYGQVMTKATLLSAAPAVAGMISLAAWVFLAHRRSRWRVPMRVGLAFGLAGIAHWLVLGFVVAPEPQSWYYAPLLIGLTMGATVTAGVAHARAARPMAAAVAPALALSLVSGTVGFLLAGPVPMDSLPMNGNFALAAEYARTGQELPKGATIHSPGEVGTLAYFCDCDIVDWLSDREQSKQYIDKRIHAAGPVMRSLLQLNYRHFPQVEPAHPSYGLVLKSPSTPGGITKWPATSPMHGRLDLRLIKMK